MSNSTIPTSSSHRPLNAKFVINGSVSALNRDSQALACRNVVERGFLLTSAIHRPKSFTKISACSPHTPDVSMTKGTKSTPAMMSALAYTWRSCRALPPTLQTSASVLHTGIDVMKIIGGFTRFCSFIYLIYLCSLK